MKILVVGMGSVGQRHAKNAVALGHEVWGYDPKNYSELPPDEYPPRPEGLMDILNPGAVIVASPPALHYEHASQAIMRGIPTFVEKPLTLDVQEAENLVSLARVQNVPLCTGFMLHALPYFTAAKQLVTSYERTWGYVYCEWQRKETTYPYPGVLWETMHELDLVLQFFGPVIAITSKNYYELSDWLSVELVHEGGITSWMTIAARASQYRRGFHIAGPADPLRAYSFRASYQPEQIQPCYVHLLRAFLEMPDVGPTGEDGLNAVRLAKMIEDTPASLTEEEEDEDR